MEVVVKLWKDLQERRIAQFLVTYCAGGWVVLTVFDQVVDRGVLPELVYRVVLTFFLCALPGALIVSWFHGAKGRQTVPVAEKWLLMVVGVLALFASGFVARSGIVGPAAAGLEGLPNDRDPRRVAVLYFDTRGGGEDAEFLAAGLTEALIDELSQVGALDIVSKNGSQLFRDTDAKPDSIGKTLGVGTLVEGTVAVAGERVRVTVAMVESRSGKQLESTEIERPRADLFDLQDALAKQVAEFLRIHIGDEVITLETRSGTRSVEAWEAYQVAQDAERAADRLTQVNDLAGASRALSRADSLMAKAESLDPLWAAPATRRGWLAYRQSRLGGFDPTHYERWIATGLEHAERAIQLAPQDPDALELRATLKYWTVLANLADKPEEALTTAETDFRNAIAANPNQASALTSLSHLLMRRGEVSEAKIKAEQSYEADPFLQSVNLTLWRLFQASWDLQEHYDARKWCDEGNRRFPADYRFSQCQLMMFALPQQEPDVQAAWRYYASFVANSPSPVRAFNEKKGLMYVSMALVRGELPDSALAVATRARASAEIDPLRELALLEAIPRSWAGDDAMAIDQFALYLSANSEQAAALRVAAEQNKLYWYLQDLADQPRFRQLIGMR